MVTVVCDHGSGGTIRGATDRVKAKQWEGWADEAAVESDNIPCKMR